MKTKYLMKKFIRLLGYEVRKSGTINRNMADFLAHVYRLGLTPKTIIDIGVASGTFELYEAYPDAFHLLVEPLEEFENALKAILNKYNGTYVIAAASSHSGQVELNVHRDFLEGSSLLKETQRGEVNGVPREIKAVRVDDLVQAHRLNSPYLMKLDVQGAELDVLEGSQTTLDETEIVLLEVSMFQFWVDGPQFYETIAYMKNHGFVAYDILGCYMRPLDGALGQMDMAFVKEKGCFRNSHSYSATKLLGKANRQ